jgi:hypothetical protein
MKIQKISPYMHRIKITLLIRFLLVLCIIVAVTAINPQVVKADVKPGWIVSCTYSHSLKDDPIVFPDQVGMAHLHDFVGARTTNAFSTFNSLAAGGTTCAMSGDESSYWVPALYENGIRILPQSNAGNSVFYYRRIGAPAGTIVRPFPPGLKILIGNAHAMSPQENPGLGTNIVFRCGPGSEGTPPLAAPPTQCASGMMVLSLTFPNCWDGVNLDSADHRSHMSYPVDSRCPASHPVNLPRLESFFRYIVGTGPIGTITLDSGPYYTAHQDFFNGWDPTTMQALVTNCINAGIDCGTDPSLPHASSASTSVNIGGEFQGNYNIVPNSSTRSSYAGLDKGPVKVISTNGTKIVASERVAYSPDGGTTWSSYSELMGLPINQVATSYTFPWYNNLDLNSQLRFGNVGTANTTVTVTIGGVVKGTYNLAPNASQRISYAGLDAGPVRITSSGNVPIIASMRVAYFDGSDWTSFSEMMGMPTPRLTSSYVFPWYNNIDLDSQLRFGNVGAAATTVTVTVAGVFKGSYPLAVNESKRISYDGLDAGPVRVTSSGNVPIIASMRVAYNDGSAWTDFSEMMGMPASSLSTHYSFPVYNNVNLNTQLRFANVGTARTTITVIINGEMKGNYTLAPNASQRISYAGLDAGPVVIQSSGNAPIIASMRVAYNDGSDWTNFAEMMGLPFAQLTNTYIFPWYNNLDLDTQLRFGVP